MNWRGLIVLMVALLVACGGQAQRDNQRPSDTALVLCGSATCGQGQICLYPPQCLGIVPDGGACPSGTTYSADKGLCLASQPSCVSPMPEQGPFDCSGEDGGAACAAVAAPIPTGCSRVCHINCV